MADSKWQPKTWEEFTARLAEMVAEALQRRFRKGGIVDQALAEVFPPEDDEDPPNGADPRRCH